ncbi:hypothetical protein TURU_135824 [Turdus rufiventris]|nr:hypothetical protein TURU_135824 [Turdus rufiventris]
MQRHRECMFRISITLCRSDQTIKRIYQTNCRVELIESSSQSSILSPIRSRGSQKEDDKLDKEMEKEDEYRSWESRVRTGSTVGDCLENQNDSGTGDSSQGKKRQKTSWMKVLQRHPGGMREFLGGSFGDRDCLDKEAKAEHHQGQEDCTVQQGNACEAEGLSGGRDSGQKWEKTEGGVRKLLRFVPTGGTKSSLKEEANRLRAATKHQLVVRMPWS